MSLNPLAPSMCSCRRSRLSPFQSDVNLHPRSVISTGDDFQAKSLDFWDEHVLGEPVQSTVGGVPVFHKDSPHAVNGKLHIVQE